MTARRQQAKFAAKLESLRAVIDAQQPHVLALQEVGSESALGKLQAALEHKLPHRAVAEPDERGIRVAIITRRVLHDPVEIRPFPAGLLPVQVGDDPPGPDGPRMMAQCAPGHGASQPRWQGGALDRRRPERAPGQNQAPTTRPWPPRSTSDVRPELAGLPARAAR